jgi:uncharacterized protein YndB with AHSA1/START domain
MNTTEINSITLEIEINASAEEIWRLWTNPEDVLLWNNMSDEWHTTRAENDLRPGGKFLFVMGLKDGSFSFDFAGTYDEIKPGALISYTLDDGRKTTITFSAGKPVKVAETFEPTKTEPVEIQRDFCQNVLNCFKAYAESKN